jgi:hypothetical protein
MAQPEREVSAAVPLGALAGDWFKAAGPEEQNLPTFLEGADAEREGNRARQRGGPDRRPGHQVSIQRLYVVIPNLGEMIVWECGKKVRSIAGDTLMHRAGECLQRPLADAGFGLGRDVG